MQRILVMMSTYNGSKYLVEQVDSIFNQERVKCVLLIRDDGSKDNTLEVIRNYKNNHPNHDIRLIEGKNVGVAASFRKLAMIAQTEHEQFDYYAFSDQDDIWLPKKLLSGITQIESLPNSQPKGYCSNSTMVNNQMEPIGNLWQNDEPVISKKRILVKNYAQGCTMVFNRAALEKYNQLAFDGVKLHDYLMALVCVFYGQLVYDSSSYLLYRQHESNVVGGIKKEKSRIKVLYNLIAHESHHDIFCQQVLAHFTDLSSDDKKLISIVANYKKNILGRLNLLCSRGIVYYRTWKENVLSGIRIIVGTY